MADTLSSVGTNIKNLMKEPGIVIIVIVSVIVLGGMYYYMYVYDPLHMFRVTLLPKPRNMLGKNKKLDLIINPTGVGINPSETEVSYSMWMFLENFGFKYGKKKHIFSHGFNPRNYKKWKHHRIIVSLGEINNTLEISVCSHKKNPDECTPENDLDNLCSSVNGVMHKMYGGEGTNQNFLLHNIPIKRWTHLFISIVGNTMSVYINGNLIKDVILEGEIIPTPKAYVFIGSSFDEENKSGFGGKLSKVEFFRKNLGPTEVYSIYREGNVPRNKKKTKFIKVDEIACKKDRETGCDRRYPDDTVKNGCCPNMTCQDGTCIA